MSNMLRVKIRKPYSFDSFTHDLSAHHITQRPVLATLVSFYKSGDVIGVLASGWTMSEDKKKWTFSIREGLTFEDGAPISGYEVKRSLSRMAFLMREKGSKSGLLELLVGYDDFQLEENNLQGIVASDDSLTLHFVEQPEKVLEKLSFGLYSIVHKSDYNSKSGEWLNPNSVISSGPYRVEESNSDHILISLRKDFPIEMIFANKKPFEKVLFGWEDNETQWDIVHGLKTDIPGENYKFMGGLLNNLAFMRLLGNKDEDSPFSDPKIRLQTRAEFYKQLEQKGFDLKRSFLPLAVQGVEEMDSDLEEMRFSDQPLLNKVVKLCDFGGKGFKREVLETLFSSIESLGGQPIIVEIDLPELITMLDPDATNTKCDAVFIITGLLVEGPWGDLRFMVKSKEGVRLPDPEGLLSTLVESQTFDLQLFNKTVWDSSLVWPVTHTAVGLWVNTNRVDFSHINLRFPATEVALIEKK